MKKLLTIFLLILIVTNAYSQNLTIPIDGVVGQDYIIVNYPDWHLQDGTVLVQDGFLNDHQCGTKTYDGHQGTDFTIRGFTQMDSGVNVLASADGQITYFIDSLYDRETAGNVALSLGNYIEIYHASTNTYSYYAHLKKNSVTVQTGDFVIAGQAIAQVGSSGNSTDPHLHYELWNPGLITDPTIDPWGIPCDSGSTLWNSPPVYDTSFAVWECGLVNYDSVENFVPFTWYSLRERLGQKDTFNVNDPFFTFWCLQYGLKIGDETAVEWYEPNGDLYFTETINYLAQDWWYHYCNSSIPVPPESKHGLWTVKYYYNNQLQKTKSFPYITPATKSEIEFRKPYYYRVGERMVNIILLDRYKYSDMALHSVSGELILTQKMNNSGSVQFTLPSNCAKGLYFIKLQGSDHEHTLKVIFD
ncbi:MAG: peptidoglycan DD-metalloendopeptidase family protein [Crocinitomicaceae bacterium]